MAHSTDPASHPGPSSASTASTALAALRRADALVLGGALLVLVFSFLPQLSVSSDVGSAHESMWHVGGLVEVFPVPLLCLVVAGLVALALLRPADRDQPLLVATPVQWAAVLSTVPVVTAVFALFFWHKIGGIGYGAFLVLVGTVLVLVGAFGTMFLPALADPLVAAKAPQQPAEESPGAYGAPPAGWAPPVAPPGSGEEPAAAPAPAPAYDAPRTYAVSTPPVDEPPVPPEPSTAPTPPPPPPAQPFWACFPTVRPLVDVATAAPVGQVTPDEWYLVTSLGDHGATVQTTDGRTGVLADVSGMVRADG